MQSIKHLYQNPCGNSPYDPEPSLGSGSFWLGPAGRPERDAGAQPRAVGRAIIGEGRDGEH
jgi:hypothetical protein